MLFRLAWRWRKTLHRLQVAECATCNDVSWGGNRKNKIFILIEKIRCYWSYERFNFAFFVLCSVGSWSKIFRKYCSTRFNKRSWWYYNELKRCYGPQETQGGKMYLFLFNCLSDIKPIEITAWVNWWDMAWAVVVIWAGCLGYGICHVTVYYCLLLKQSQALLTCVLHSVTSLPVYGAFT